MNQASTIGLGMDANTLAGYAFVANDRLGNFDMVFENTGSNEAYVRLKEYDGVTSPSGYVNLGSAFTVAPRGTKTVSLNLLSQRVGIFGSGNTTLNMTTVVRNPANLRGAQIDVVVSGRRGWGFDAAYPKDSYRPDWGQFPDTTPNPPAA